MIASYFRRQLMLERLLELAWVIVTDDKQPCLGVLVFNLMALSINQCTKNVKVLRFKPGLLIYKHWAYL